MAHQPDAASAKKTLKGLAYAGGIGGPATAHGPSCLPASQPASRRPAVFRSVARRPSCTLLTLFGPLFVLLFLCPCSPGGTEVRVPHG